MTDSTLNVTQPLDHPEKFIKIVDNEDGTYSIAVSGGLEAAEAAVRRLESEFVLKDLLGQILLELQKMNVYLAHLSDVEVSDMDAGG